MVQPTELRIGNMVNCRIGKELAKDYPLTGVVKSISYYNALATNYTLPATSSSIFEVDIENNIDQFDPIPLTEEWLVKCGFEKDDCELPDKYQDRYRIWSTYWLSSICIEQYTVSVNNEPDMFIFEFDKGYNSVERNIESVHQLQNLVYALSGEELNIEI